MSTQHVKQLIAFARELLQLFGRRGAVDAGDQKALRLSLREQLHRFIDAGDPAGQYGDAVGGALGHRLAPLQVAGEDEKADDKQHDGEQQRIEDEPERAHQELEGARRFRRFFPHRLLHLVMRGATIGSIESI